MYKRWERLSLALMIIMMLLLGACGQSQSQYELPELTTTPKAKATNIPAVEATSTPEASLTATPKPSMTIIPTREAVPEKETEVIVTPMMPSPTLEPETTPIPTATPALEPARVGTDGLLLDNELCKVQVTSLEKGEYYYVLYLSVENRTEEELKFYVGDVYVNRVECCAWDCEVPAGETIEEELTLYDVEKYAGVTEILDITELYLPLEIYDESEAWLDIFEVSREGYLPEPIFQQTIYYYPQGEEQYVPFVYERQLDDIVVADDEELTLLIIGDIYNEGGGYEIKLFLENHTDKRVWYEIEELSLNGFLCEPFYEWECDLYPETGTYGTIEYFDYWKDETEGDTITEICFSLSAGSIDYEYGFWGDYTVNLQGEESAQEYVYVLGEQED